MSKIYPYAGFWRRFGAFLIDSIILSVPLNGLYFLFMWPHLQTLMTQPPAAQGDMLQFQAISWGFQILSLLVFWLYFSLMESSRHQATLGKMVLGIKVVDAQGKRLSFAHATGRTLGKIISGLTLYIGFMIAGANKHKQALHDIMASAYVVSKHYEEGQPLEEVETHYGLLGLSIAGLFLVFALFFAALLFLIVGGIMQVAGDSQNVKSSFTTQKIQDMQALAKINSLQQLPQERRTPFQENGYAFTFEEDGTVRAQRAGEASYAFIMRPNELWPCCQPLVPDGCADAINVDVCQAK